MPSFADAMKTLVFSAETRVLPARMRKRNFLIIGYDDSIQRLKVSKGCEKCGLDDWGVDIVIDFLAEGMHLCGHATDFFGRESNAHAKHPTI